MFAQDLQIALITLNNLINKYKKQFESEGYDIHLSPIMFNLKDIKKELVSVCNRLKTKGKIPCNFSVYLKRLNIPCHRSNFRTFNFTLFYNDWIKLKEKLIASFINPHLKNLFLLDKPLEDVNV